jgi:hypothetical protein
MFRLLGVFLLTALLAAAGARADAERAGFLVTATIPERVVLETVEQPAQISISEADVERGYKDASARYVVSQNTARGWMLRFAPRLGVARQVEIRGLHGAVVLRDQGVDVFRPGGSGREQLALDFRFVLDAGVPPGTYDLPVHVAATPL